MTAARPGDTFHVDLDGTVIAGRYIEVERRSAWSWLINLEADDTTPELRRRVAALPVLADGLDTAPHAELRAMFEQLNLEVS